MPFILGHPLVQNRHFRTKPNSTIKGTKNLPTKISDNQFLFFSKLVGFMFKCYNIIFKGGTSQMGSRQGLQLQNLKEEHSFG